MSLSNNQLYPKLSHFIWKGVGNLGALMRLGSFYMCGFLIIMVKWHILGQAEIMLFLSNAMA